MKSKIFLSVLTVLILTNCTKKTDISMYTGNYKGNYHGYKRIYFGLVPTEDNIEGEETFIIKAGTKENTVILCMDEQEIEGKVIGRKVHFDDFIVTTNDELFTINEHNKISGKFKDGNKFSYVNVIEGTAYDANNVSYHVEGYFEGTAIKQ